MLTYQVIVVGPLTRELYFMTENEQLARDKAVEAGTDNISNRYVLLLSFILIESEVTKMGQPDWLANTRKVNDVSPGDGLA